MKQGKESYKELEERVRPKRYGVWVSHKPHTMMPRRDGKRINRQSKEEGWEGREGGKGGRLSTSERGKLEGGNGERRVVRLCGG